MDVCGESTMRNHRVSPMRALRVLEAILPLHFGKALLEARLHARGRAALIQAQPRLL